jgi:hypothetical protein
LIEELLLQESLKNVCHLENLLRVGISLSVFENIGKSLFMDILILCMTQKSVSERATQPHIPCPSGLLPLLRPRCLVLVARLHLILGNKALFTALSSSQKIDAHP